MNIPADLTKEELDKLVLEGVPDIESLNDFNAFLNQLKNLGLNYKMPRILTYSKLEDINSRFEDGMSAADEIISELQSDTGAFLELGDELYEVRGMPPNANMEILKAEILKRCISDNWDNDKQIRSAIKKIFPQVSIRKMRDED